MRHARGVLLLAGAVTLVAPRALAQAPARHPLRSLEPLGAAVTTSDDSTLIAAAQRVLVSDLDAAYPRVRFIDWFAELARVPAAAIHWDLNDCGEGGDGRAAPTCVEAWVDLAGDTATVNLIVADLEGAPAPPKIWRCYAMHAGQVTDLATLGDLVAYVRRRR